MDSRQSFVVDRAYDAKRKRWVRGPHYMRHPPVLRRICAEAFSKDENGIYKYRTIVLALTKKSGKSALEASFVEYYAWSEGSHNELYLIANDEDQVRYRAYGDLIYSLRHSPWLPADIRTAKGTIVLKGNDTTIFVLGQHYQSAAGSRHGLTAWDELWTYETELHYRMWDELTPIPTEDNSIRLIVTYAGFMPGSRGRVDERNLLWDLYSDNVGRKPDGEMEWPEGKGIPIPGLEDLPCWSNGSVFVCWMHDPVQPWQTPEYYAAERREQRASAYVRQHENRWVSSTEEFIDMHWWDAATILPAPKQPDRSVSLSVGVDFAPKHDRAAVVATYMDKHENICQAFHKIWHGSPDAPLHPGIVGNYLIEIFTLHRIRNIRYDPYQFLGTAMSLAALKLPMEEWNSGDPNYVAMTEELYRLLKYHRFRTYADDECREHIVATVVEQKPTGMRISKTKGGKNDYAVALAMAAHYTVISGGETAGEPLFIESPFADLTELPMTVEQAELQRVLPRELRDPGVDGMWSD